MTRGGGSLLSLAGSIAAYVLNPGFLDPCGGGGGVGAGHVVDRSCMGLGIPLKVKA